VITEEHVLRLFDQANPIPDVDLLDMEQSGAARHLATLEQRSSEVTRLDTRPTEKAKPSLRRLKLVLGAAAVVVLIGAVVVLNQDDGNAPPATQPAPTIVTPTTTPAQSDQAALAVAQEFMAARSEWDGNTVESLLAVDATIAGTEFVESSADYPALSDYERAVGWRYLNPDCAVSSPGRIRCTYTLETDVTRALGVGPYHGNSFVLDIEDGLIQTVTHNFSPDQFLADTAPFNSWLAATYPSDVELMFVPSASGGDEFARITPDSIALWENHTAEFVAEQSG